MPVIWTMVWAVLAVTLAYALYTQWSPSMGGIWIRVDADNQPVFVFSNLLRLMVAPLDVTSKVGRAFWSEPSLVVINWPLIIVTTCLLVWIASTCWTCWPAASVVPELR